MWALLPPVALLLGHLARPTWAECPPSQKGNDTSPCNCVAATRIFRDCLHCPPELGCQCSSSEGLLNVTQFYARACQGLPSNAIYVAVVVPIMGLLLIAALTYFLVRSKKGEPLAHDKWEPDAIEGQPRYVGRAGPQGHQGNYENILVGQGPEGGQHQSRRGSKNRPRRVSDVDGPYGQQPIYANTQGMYYNYRKGAKEGEEAVYISPDE
ncbi:hypothetical protein JD844_033948 [Phrynosoma platyrhinos]|uniref:Uncharacterized protein n=1 Tax=Phrynosoma platyrhinos TaxID=52577 RepID=A0ABQ7T7M1_PHRPL|nr:hypothetical protein JD844_033948 [Phrynosoma platyrhinos]